MSRQINLSLFAIRALLAKQKCVFWHLKKLFSFSRFVCFDTFSPVRFVFLGLCTQIFWHAHVHVYVQTSHKTRLFKSMLIIRLLSLQTTFYTVVAPTCWFYFSCHPFRFVQNLQVAPLLSHFFLHFKSYNWQPRAVYFSSTLIYITLSPLWAIKRNFSVFEKTVWSACD